MPSAPCPTGMRVSDRDRATAVAPKGASRPPEATSRSPSGLASAGRHRTARLSATAFALSPLQKSPETDRQPARSQRGREGSQHFGRAERDRTLEAYRE